MLPDHLVLQTAVLLSLKVVNFTHAAASQRRMVMQRFSQPMRNDLSGNEILTEPLMIKTVSGNSWQTI